MLLGIYPLTKVGTFGINSTKGTQLKILQAEVSEKSEIPALRLKINRQCSCLDYELSGKIFFRSFRHKRAKMRLRSGLQFRPDYPLSIQLEYFLAEYFIRRKLKLPNSILHCPIIQFLAIHYPLATHHLQRHFSCKTFFIPSKNGKILIFKYQNSPIYTYYPVKVLSRRKKN